ncbi:MAG: hypothetical protein F6J93_37100 [Oscillatoria sp. SIO1A7]|nr:hypothetical protein [Oscillatoria sp. SIO1A7]
MLFPERSVSEAGKPVRVRRLRGVRRDDTRMSPREVKKPQNQHPTLHPCQRLAIVSVQFSIGT